MMEIVWMVTLIGKFADFVCFYVCFNVSMSVCLILK